MDLTGNVAVVTGASSGIGEAAARTLAREGCTVALAARREDRLEALADEIGAEKSLVVPTDVADEADAAALIETTRERLGGVDILVNNAGVARGDPVADADLRDLRRNVRVNLEGVMNVTHAALPTMLDAGSGDIVTVSSMSARFPQEGGSGYTASKFGVNGFCRSLRKELSDEQVRVTIVMPGPVVTELNDWDHWDGRALDPADVASAIEFVVSRPAHVEIPDITVNSTDKLG
ncbi:oxidoreductase [Halobacteriales archaeon QS_9_68_17]|nr:MAG: oxidoreductase [Halobacteriales archaeon QS_9_68_17]